MDVSSEGAGRYLLFTSSASNEQVVHNDASNAKAVTIFASVSFSSSVSSSHSFFSGDVTVFELLSTEGKGKYRRSATVNIAAKGVSHSGWFPVRYFYHSSTSTNFVGADPSISGSFGVPFGYVCY